MDNQISQERQNQIFDFGLVFWKFELDFKLLDYNIDHIKRKSHSTFVSLSPDAMRLYTYFRIMIFNLPGNKQM